MRADLRAVLDACFSIMKLRLEIYGYHISLWNVLAFGAVSGLCGWVIWEVLNRD